MNNFCPKCYFSFNIQKTIKLMNIKNINEFINHLVNNKINLKLENNITLENIKSNKLYLDLNKNDQEIVNSNYKKFRNLNKIGFYMCNSCGYFKNITNGTIIFNNIEKSNSDINISNIQKDNNILPRTKDYICPNKKCKANDISYESVDKEAVFYRINNTYKLNYTCCLCSSNWEI